MAMIWIEILSRHYEVLSRQRVALPDEGAVGIGRAYDNLLVLDDPYVAPHHVELRRDAAGGVIVRDLGSRNGLVREDTERRVETLELGNDSVFRIGRTLLRVRTEAAAVAPERPLGRTLRAWPAALAAAGGLFSLELLSYWLTETADPEVSRYLTPMIGISVVLLLWTAAWSVAARIFSGHAHFGRHLLFAVSGLLGLSLANELSSLAAFAFSWSSLSRYQPLLWWVAIALVSFWHLREISPARLRLKGGIVGALALVLMSAQVITQSEMRKHTGRSTYLTTLQPPAVRIMPPKSSDDFFAKAAKLQAALDKARTEELPNEGSAFDLDD